MQKAHSGWFGFFLFILLAVSLACSSTAAPTPAPTATAVPPTLTATATLKPTSTPRPTATPNLAATQEIDARLKLLQTYADAGYITATGGEFENIDDFHEEWPQLNWYQWWPLHQTTTNYGDLIFRAHFSWQTATRTSDTSGCGIVFGVQPNGDHYGVFIDKARILFLMNRGGQAYQVGKTKGSGRLSIAEPAEADVTVIVRGATAYVLVDEVATQYTLSADQPSSGEFALSLLSGTNKDFGTRCDMTGAYIWTPDE
jgi:hypothetical protein